ncbi:unnamed protein product [Phytophthora lilii]|uniref:Unnamed protein product n=1 Tax=Phytophthora lilii TaxID=2077276 RepID=A0A9W6TYV8_9STRA|nr:unnamed protein product [Phytophthora lilii]
MDPRMCPLLNLAVYIETAANVASSSFLFSNSYEGDRVVRILITEKIKHSEFKTLNAGKQKNWVLTFFEKVLLLKQLGSGVSKDFINRRGRWRTRNGVVDVCIDHTQLYLDAYTAAVLAGPTGPCFYSLKEGMRCVTSSFLVDEVAPAIKQVLGESVAKTLAHSLLWAALEPEISFDFDPLPQNLRSRIVKAYINAGGSVDLNPICREDFYALGDGSQLNPIVPERAEQDASNITSVAGRTGSGTGRASVGNCGGNSDRREITALHSQFASSRRYTTDIMNNILRSRNDFQRELQTVKAVLRRIAIQPFAGQAATRQQFPGPSLDVRNNNSNRHTTQARLSERPKDLYKLWHEYQFGYNGLEAAKELTPAERGATKFAYCRRKLFWDVIDKMVRSGYTSGAAIDKVYQVYGRQLSVSSILVALRSDRTRGGHPSLR